MGSRPILFFFFWTKKNQNSFDVQATQAAMPAKLLCSGNGEQGLKTGKGKTQSQHHWDEEEQR
jgi:hypothetical protein